MVLDSSNFTVGPVIETLSALILTFFFFLQSLKIYLAVVEAGEETRAIGW